VILRPEDYQRWVFEDSAAALKLAGPYPAQVMTAVQLGPQINSPHNDVPELLQPCA
jgi:putative SOS response-associated peptidase YedK